MEVNITPTIKTELRKLEVSLQSDITDYLIVIKGFGAITKFFKKEFAFWDKSENKGDVISQLFYHFEDLNANIGDFHKSLDNSTDVSALNTQWA